MIRNIAIGVLLVVDALLCLLCLRAFRSNGSISVEQQSDQIHKMGYLESVIKYGVQNNDILLDGDAPLAGRNGETLQLKDLAADSAKLFVRISDLHCEECVRFILLKLIRLSNENLWPNDRIVILGSFQHIRSLFVLADQVGVRFPIYNMEKPDIPAEQNNMPYCFIMDSALRINHLFFPDKYEGGIANIYLGLTGNRYWSRQQSP